MAAPLRIRLRAEILTALSRAASPARLVLWCDPTRTWREVLRGVAELGDFELWADDEHELLLRERLLAAPPAARVVWLPFARDQIRYLKVFELEAELVWTESIVETLQRFGVDGARALDARVLAAYAIEWLDRPAEAWRELSPGTARAGLVNDDRVLEALASKGVPLTVLFDADRFSVFATRADQDFGLPRPAPGSDDDWRIAATARLLATDAAVRLRAESLPDAAFVIPPGAARDDALRMLDRWQKHVELMTAFEDLAIRADARLSPRAWLGSTPRPAPPMASRAAEQALLDREIAQLGRLESFDALARHLEEHLAQYADHERGFWGSRAEKRVAWSSLAALSRAAEALGAQAGVQNQWRTPGDAVEWFTTSGWRVDRQGEILFREDRFLPPGLKAARDQLRRAYLRHVDAINAAFSELLETHGVDGLRLPFAGEALATARPARDAMAVLVLDACRLDLGMRLAEALNAGEPVIRAEVGAARAPLPSITALGMPFALADEPAALSVRVTDGDRPRWDVAGPHGRDLAEAGARRDWLARRFQLKPGAISHTKTVLDEGAPNIKDAGRLAFVFGDEFDKAGHEGELEFIGGETYIDRYVRVIRRLRDAGYSTVVVVTDHGFVQWEPEDDEVQPPPTGTVLWRSRRAMVGHDLSHPTAVALPVPGSDLECLVPRSVNAFQTYGRLGFFHGGATLQELVIPVVICRWPRRAQKTSAVLTPVAAITSLRPRIEVRPGATGHLPEVGPGAETTGRPIKVQAVEAASGRRLFHSAASAMIEPGGQPVTVTLDRQAGETCARGTRLRIELRDADNDELLDHCDADLGVDLEEWD